MLITAAAGNQEVCVANSPDNQKVGVAYRTDNQKVGVTHSEWKRKKRESEQRER